MLLLLMLLLLELLLLLLLLLLLISRVVTFSSLEKVTLALINWNVRIIIPIITYRR